jgi:hypothetical protein
MIKQKKKLNFLYFIGLGLIYISIEKEIYTQILFIVFLLLPPALILERRNEETAQIRLGCTPEQRSFWFWLLSTGDPKLCRF